MAYLVQNHPVGIIFGHVATRGHGLIVWGVVPEGDRRPVELFGGTRSILQRSQSLCMGHGEGRAGEGVADPCVSFWQHRSVEVRASWAVWACWRVLELEEE